MRALGALASGDDPTVDELTDSLSAVQDLLYDLHQARGPMRDIDVTDDWTAGENQRIRIQAGADINVTLPNSVRTFPYCRPYDYDFQGQTSNPIQGSTGIADGVEFRQPRDGTRIEIVGVNQALYFYRSDTNSWMAASGLALDDELPLSAPQTPHFTSGLIGRLMDVFPAQEPSPSVARRIARGNAALMLRPGVKRDQTVGEYF